MDEELEFKQMLGFVFKEMRVGFFNGLIVGSISFIFTGVFIWLVRGQQFMDAFAISGCIGIALALAMLISSFVGAIIPIILDKIGFDPAVASGPLISTVSCCGNILRTCMGFPYQHITFIIKNKGSTNEYTDILIYSLLIFRMGI